MSETTNSVRQILMNELGLTRQSIKEETTKIVEETVQKELKRLFETDGWIKLVKSAVNDYLKENSYRYTDDKIRNQIHGIAVEEMKNYIIEHVTIGIKNNT